MSVLMEKSQICYKTHCKCKDVSFDEKNHKSTIKPSVSVKMSVLMEKSQIYYKKTHPSVSVNISVLI